MLSCFWNKDKCSVIKVWKTTRESKIFKSFPNNKTIIQTQSIITERLIKSLRLYTECNVISAYSIKSLPLMSEFFREVRYFITRCLFLYLLKGVSSFKRKIWMCIKAAMIILTKTFSLKSITGVIACSLYLYCLFTKMYLPAFSIGHVLLLCDVYHAQTIFLYKTYG